ncbi:PAS domain S-box protein [Trichlorobacter lovleyi]|uniref:two-component system sensor histidine kinase NtrB n=1 Tax=Trichlorobacter lovleyi TaxID=313985 RepID=UPI00223FD012|nr:ATP-binding protein [Trichlorobacter lovleyi]QOX78693.1 PAS domain S-box protein [Trichlorobacter lovleyi]
MKTERRLRLFIFARIVVVVLFLVSTIILKLSDAEAISDIQFRGVVELMVLSCCVSLVSLAALRRQSWLLPLTRLQIVWDILFVTLLLMLTDGIASPYSFLYLLAIMSAGMLLNRQQALYTAALCIILYGAMVDLQYFGMLRDIGLSPETAQQRGNVVIFYTLFLHLVGFVLAAIMGSHLAERARLTEVNYEELKQLHSTIVENLESGLLTITRDGLIRVFNPYVEKMTGMTQVHAYGRPISAVFPSLPVVSGAFEHHGQGEFYYRPASGTPLTIGYATMPFRNLQGETAGLIVTLKDLTGFKQMELALKRSDRLAALGELSARMAHEIRNPLAAISGSVQLLAEHGSLREHESRLLAIVMRESDRLNGLITDFLAYARPTPPRFERFNLYHLVRDLQALLMADSRFDKIRLVLDLSEDLTAWADRDQLQQVLLNLLHNAAEAMPDGGEIVVSADLQSGTDDAGRAFSLLCLKVMDQGCGMNEDTCRHLFEPFWTTKPAGTGLGLATVYRIVEGHGGMIQADPRDGGGTMMTLLLPMMEEGPGENQNTGR